MRSHLFGLLLLAIIAGPAMGQPRDPIERRVDRIEQELRAVQRRVFPNGRAQFIDPEIRPSAVTAPPPGPTGDALTSLTDRVNALEGQLRALTNQVEEQGFRTRQLEEQITQLRTELQGRLDRLERPVNEPATEPASTSSPNEEPAETPDQPEAAASSAATAEEAYNEGYRLWDARQYRQAQQSLEAAATRFPGSRWTSWMRNLQGRAYLDDDKPATAARIFLANYQDNPSGERAADSLYYLGEALNRLNRRPEACRVYDELEQAYPAMRAHLRERLPQARADARCSTTASRR